MTTESPPSAQAEAVATPLRVIAERVVTEHAYLERREHWFTGLESMALALASEAVKASVALDASERALVAMTRERDDAVALVIEWREGHAAADDHTNESGWRAINADVALMNWIDEQPVYVAMLVEMYPDSQLAKREVAPVPDGGESSQ